MLKARVITAIFLLVFFSMSLFMLPVPAWLTLCTLICAGASWEWGGFARFSYHRRIAFSAVTALMCGMLGIAAGLDTGALRPEVLLGCYGMSAAFWLIGVPVWLRKKWTLLHPLLAVCVGWVVLIPPALALAHLRLVEPSPWMVLTVMAVVWVADIAAYFTGRSIGRRKLAPAISPGKTWEGAAGAVVGVWVFGFAVIFFAGYMPQMSLLVVALLVPVFLGWTALSIMGDLFESLLKRQVGIKDSGRLLPGHGGILDRIDSLTSTLPLVGIAALWLMN